MVSIRMAHGDTADIIGSTVADRVIGLVAFTLAVVLLRCLPFRTTLAIARAFKRLGRRPASRADAERAIVSRDWAAHYFPGRVACLENSLAAFLAAALCGRSMDWLIGCRFAPAESHAWVEADGGPIGEPDMPDRPFHVTVRV